MGEIKEIYSDTEFDINKSELYRLSVLFSRDSCFYMITHDKSVLLINGYRPGGNFDTLSNAWDSFSDYILSQPHFKRSYKSIHLGTDTFKTVIQPREICDDGKETALLRSVTKVYPVEKILTEDWKNEEKVQISGLPEYLLGCISRTFPGSDVKHIYHTVHRYIVTNLLLLDSNLIVNLNYSCAQFWFYRDGRLQFVNQFDFMEIRDLVYHIGKICNHYLLPGHEVNIYVSGRSSFDITHVIAEIGNFFERVEKLSKTKTGKEIGLNNYLDVYSLME